MCNCGSNAPADAKEIESLCLKAIDKLDADRKKLITELVDSLMARRWFPPKSRAVAEEAVLADMTWDSGEGQYIVRRGAAIGLLDLCRASNNGTIFIDKDDARFIHWMKGIV
jgi:hypothetical protein